MITRNLVDRTFKRTSISKLIGSVLGVTEPVIEWVSWLDGLGQYWRFSEILEVPAGAKIRFKMTGVTDVPYISEVLFGHNEGDTARTRLYLDNTQGVPAYLKEKGDITGTVDGIDMGGSYPLDGLTHQVELSVTNTFYIKDIGAHNNGKTYFLEGCVHDFEILIDGVVTYKIPLTNKDQGVTQLSTVGNISATMANYTEAVWKYVPTFDEDPWVLIPDGESSVIDIPEAFIRDGDYFEFSFLAPTEKVANNLFGFTIGSNQLIVNFNLEGTVGASRSTVLIDGVALLSGNNLYPTDGKVHIMRVEGTSFGVISRIYTNAYYQNYSTVPIWNLKIIGADQGDFFYPLDDGPNSTELRELTQQGVGATLTQGNGTWRRLSELT